MCVTDLQAGDTNLVQLSLFSWHLKRRPKNNHGQKNEPMMPDGLFFIHDFSGEEEDDNIAI
jgi:hypothetical protein